jgi:general secretion pathway protein K
MHALNPSPFHRQARPGHRRQRGAALLMAMVIVTLVTTVASSMVWQQWRAVQVESAERALTQSHWILQGALDWARLILREDGRSSNEKVDHLGEPWAVELAEARLSSFLAADQNNNAADEGPEAFMSGKISDVTARYNLRNLIDDTKGDVDPDQLAVLRRLCEYASLSPALADGIAQALRKSLLAKASADQPEALSKLGGTEAVAAAPLMPQTVDQLVWLGLDAGSVARLKPYVMLLPEVSPININTASREVISAVMPGVDLGRADRIVQTRARTPFKSTADLKDILGVGINIPADNVVTVSSSYFEVFGRLRLEDRIITQNYILQRTGNDELTVLFENRVSGVEALPVTQGRP